MIDYLALRVPGKAPFTQGFGHLYSSMREPKRWKATKHYATSSAWDDCGLDVLLHVGCQMTKVPMHKMEILRVGEKSYAEIVELAGRVFDLDAEKLGIMRVDLTADVKGVPVDWFKHHTLVKMKQTRREHGSVEPYLTIRKGTAETLYAGVKPNQIRIYDKVAERRMQYGKMLTRFARESAGLDVEATPFETLYGHGMFDVITRVERQIAARDIEKMGFSDVRSLQRAVFMNPFDRVLFFDQPLSNHLREEDWSFETWCAGMHLNQRVREFGVSETTQFMKSRLGKNFDRARKKFAPFLRMTDNVVGIDAERLKQTFQTSAYKQLLCDKVA